MQNAKISTLIVMTILSLTTLNCTETWAKKDYKPLPAEKREITVYHSPTCGCCKKWLTHLEDHKFKVKSVEKRDMRSIKLELGMPLNMASCHTAVSGKYLIEGHVPAQDIIALHHSGKDVKGLSVPRMPVGPPGMEGKRKDPFKVIAFDQAGQTSIFREYSDY